MAEQPTSPAEYRKGKTKTFKCTSGFVVLLRKMPPKVMAGLLTKLELQVQPGTPIEQAKNMLAEKMKTPAYTEKIVQAAEYVVPRIVIEPKILDGSTESPDPNALTIDEIGPGDLFEIFSEGVDFSGLTGAAEEMRQKFRGESPGEDAGQSSTQPQPAT